MIEKEVTKYLREWLESNGFLIFTGAEFNVRHADSKRPDMTVINNETGFHSALKIKRSRGNDIHKAYKIVDYALDYCKGAEYRIFNKNVGITNFLVATNTSKEGRLFDKDVLYDEERRKKQADAYDGWGHGRVEPYVEYVKTGEFVRAIWRRWREREGMKEVKIGILLSSINDKASQSLRKPKIFVMCFDMIKERWKQQWMAL